MVHYEIYDTLEKHWTDCVRLNMYIVLNNSWNHSTDTTKSQIFASYILRIIIHNIFSS